MEAYNLHYDPKMSGSRFFVEKCHVDSDNSEGPDHAVAAVVAVVAVVVISRSKDFGDLRE